MPVELTTLVKFLSTLSLRRATFITLVGAARGYISIHALLAESDSNYGVTLAYMVIFLSTLSLRRATGSRSSSMYWQKISIHALLAESDHWLFGIAAVVDDISIHALLAESDLPALQGA